MNIKLSLLKPVFILSLLLGYAGAKGDPDGYDIKIQIKGITDSVCYLANYFGDKTYLTDTAIVGNKGNFAFKGDSILPGGIYIVAGETNNRYFEIIIDKEQVFSITTDVLDINGKIKFEGSEDNTLFFEYINKNVAGHLELEDLNKQKINSQHIDDSLNYYNDKIEKLTQRREEYKRTIIEEYPESFVSVILKAMKELHADNIPILENGREDSAYAYQYYKTHYWDNIDLTDERLLRTPLFHNKVDKYFTKVLFQHPDTITSEADILIDRTKPNKETFKYIVWYLTFKYEASKVMGFDEIFVHMVDNYYATGLAYWADPSVVESLTERAEALRPILIGSKAPELILMDSTGGFTSLHYSQADYMVVFFYESDCGHCKKEIKALKTWYDENDLGLEVFAICTDTSLVKWKNFVEKHELNWINVNGTRSVTRDYHDLYDIRMTPTLFLLNRKKEIIAKRLNIEQLISFLNSYNETHTLE